MVLEALERVGCLPFHPLFGYGTPLLATFLPRLDLQCIEAELTIRKLTILGFRVVVTAYCPTIMLIQKLGNVRGQSPLIGTAASHPQLAGTLHMLGLQVYIIVALLRLEVLHLLLGRVVLAGEVGDRDVVYAVQAAPDPDPEVRGHHNAAGLARTDEHLQPGNALDYLEQVPLVQGDP